MAIQIIKQGIADSLQDKGRYGYQHLGIPPCGYIDYLSAQLANHIVGNPLDAPLFELHFPASSFIFDQDETICISGAAFIPILNEKSIALNTLVHVSKNDTLHFMQPQLGRTAYLAIKGKIKGQKWLDSYSQFSNSLKKGDSFEVDPIENVKTNYSTTLIQNIQKTIFNTLPIRFIPGPHWNDLSEESIFNLLHQPFHTTLQSNRMGYHLKGPSIKTNQSKSYLSSAVTKGTMQLLPKGDIIVLMADHQTIGGYANIGQIILVDLPKLVQYKNDTGLNFKITNIETAHSNYIEVQQWFK